MFENLYDAEISNVQSSKIMNESGDKVLPAKFIDGILGIEVLARSVATIQDRRPQRSGHLQQPALIFLSVSRDGFAYRAIITANEIKVNVCAYMQSDAQSLTYCRESSSFF